MGKNETHQEESFVASANCPSRTGGRLRSWNREASAQWSTVHLFNCLHKLWRSTYFLINTGIKHWGEGCKNKNDIVPALGDRSSKHWPCQSCDLTSWVKAARAVYEVWMLHKYSWKDFRKKLPGNLTNKGIHMYLIIWDFGAFSVSCSRLLNISKSHFSLPLSLHNKLWISYSSLLWKQVQGALADMSTTTKVLHNYLPPIMHPKCCQIVQSVISVPSTIVFWIWVH